METQNDNKTAGVIRSILTSEVKFIISVIGFVVGVVTPYYSLKQDVALIQNDISNINSNHEVHIQDILQEQKEINQRLEAQHSAIIELQKSNAVLLSKVVN